LRSVFRRTVRSNVFPIAFCTLSTVSRLLKLTKLQSEVLVALRDGQLLTLDKTNMPFLGARALQPQTRYFLTKNRLVTRKNTASSIESEGNGFTISKKGLALLQVLSLEPVPR
jgi:hypothetical protein